MKFTKEGKTINHLLNSSLTKYRTNMEKDFELVIEEQSYKFSLDKQGVVWLKESNESGTNYGQTRPVYSIEEAKETAKLMLYSMGKIKRN